jgi:glycosyltransferase involved in cell wall biosynthesis
MKPKLSILTATIPGREKQVTALQSKIEQQRAELCQPWKNDKTWPSRVEHLVLSDNKTRSIGAKRQALVDIARGDYIAFVDDDDDISDDYVASLLAATETGADCITFRQRAFYNDLESEVVFDVNHKDEPFKPGGITKRAPWQPCAWRREAVQDCVYQFANYDEDTIWCIQARGRIRTGHHIDRILHTYRHNSKKSGAGPAARENADVEARDQ